MGTISTYLGGLPLRVLFPATCCPPPGRRDTPLVTRSSPTCLRVRKTAMGYEGHDKHQLPS